MIGLINEFKRAEAARRAEEKDRAKAIAGVVCLVACIVYAVLRYFWPAV